MQKQVTDWFAVAACACAAAVAGMFGGVLSSMYTQAQLPAGPSPAEVTNNSKLLTEHAMQLRDIRRELALAENKRVEGDLYNLTVFSRLVGEVRCIQDTLKLPAKTVLPTQRELHPAKAGPDVPADGLIPKQALPTQPIDR